MIYSQIVTRAESVWDSFNYTCNFIWISFQISFEAHDAVGLFMIGRSYTEVIDTPIVNRGITCVLLTANGGSKRFHCSRIIGRDKVVVIWDRLRQHWKIRHRPCDHAATQRSMTTFNPCLAFSLLPSALFRRFPHSVLRFVSHISPGNTYRKFHVGSR